MDWLGSVLRDESHRPTRYLRGRATGIPIDGCVVVVDLYANLSPDPSLSAEDTESKEQAEGLPLTSNSHRAGRSPVLLLNNFIILLVEVGNFLMFVMDRNDP